MTTMPGQKTAQRHSLGRNTSVLLDVIRFFAAAVVATTHLSTFVQSKPLLPKESANAAVCIFFVLSGFVIRYVTVTRETDAAEYWIDRASRIYSVVAPTLALTVLFEGAAFLGRPAIYHAFAQHYTWTQVPEQLLTNMTFTSGYWGYGAAPLSNLPFWSLPYECLLRPLRANALHKEASLVCGTRDPSPRRPIDLGFVYCVVDGRSAL